MVFKSKKERFVYSHRSEIAMCIYAVFCVISGVLGHKSAFLSNLTGFFDVTQVADLIINSISLPVLTVALSFLICDTRKMLIAVMISKVTLTLTALLFGTNLNIYMPVFRDDWGVVFFIATDIFIAVTVYNERFERRYIKGAISVIVSLMAVSVIIGLLEGNFAFHYVLRSLSVFLFYRSVYTVICHIVPLYRNMLNSHERKRFEKQPGSDKDA